MLRRYCGVVSPKLLNVQVSPIHFASTESNMQRSDQHVKEKASTESKKNAEKAYASTLLLPKTAFPIWVEPAIASAKYHDRTTQGLYKWQVRDLMQLLIDADFNLCGRKSISKNLLLCYTMALRTPMEIYTADTL